MPVLSQSKFAGLQQEIEAAAQPATHLERWFAEEILHAASELERVRANTANTAAESRLNAAYSRASRNWNRARKELQALQTARVNHVARLSPSRQKIAAAPPLADPARAPQPKLAGPMAEHLLDLIQTGITSQQEAR